MNLLKFMGFSRWKFYLLLLSVYVTILTILFRRDHHSEWRKFIIASKSHLRSYAPIQRSQFTSIVSKRPDIRDLQNCTLVNVSHESIQSFSVTNPVFSSPSSYPQFDSLLNILQRWPPDEPDFPASFVFNETLQHFNYSSPHERAAAEKYRNAELPFKLYSIPNVEEVRRLWTDSYLVDHIHEVAAHVEESGSNHFMYWSKKAENTMIIEAPTTLVDMSLSDWLENAYEADYKKIDGNNTHYYFMFGVSQYGRSFVNRDLRIFSASEPNFFITKTEANKGIQCRMSTRGIISEAHYDSGRNMVMMVRGAKRYILTPPSTCDRLDIINDPSHPSYRHSSLDWSDLLSVKLKEFSHVPAIDTVLQEGEILYIPSFWFHYIISLTYSIQCNTRSGTPQHEKGQADIASCFHSENPSLRKKLPGVAPWLNKGDRERSNPREKVKLKRSRKQKGS